MERISVESTSIASIGYDESSSTLEIEFCNGSVYQYFDVGTDVYENLIGAASQGSFLATNIKGSYRYSRV